MLLLKHECSVSMRIVSKAHFNNGSLLRYYFLCCTDCIIERKKLGRVDSHFESLSENELTLLVKLSHFHPVCVNLTSKCAFISNELKARKVRQLVSFFSE